MDVELINLIKPVPFELEISFQELNFTTSKVRPK